MDMTSWKTGAKRLRSEIHALCLAARDPRTPWYAKALAAFIIGYVLSPVDLIPDFIPVIGYLDDLIIVPAGITILIKIMPKEILLVIMLTYILLFYRSNDGVVNGVNYVF